MVVHVDEVPPLSHNTSQIGRLPVVPPPPRAAVLHANWRAVSSDVCRMREAAIDCGPQPPDGGVGCLHRPWTADGALYLTTYRLQPPSRIAPISFG